MKIEDADGQSSVGPNMPRVPEVSMIYSPIHSHLLTQSVVIPIVIPIVLAIDWGGKSLNFIEEL